MRGMGFDERVAIMFLTQDAVDRFGSQQELAKQMGVSQQTVSRYVNNPLAPVGYSAILMQIMGTNMPVLLAKMHARISDYKKRQAPEPAFNALSISEPVQLVARGASWLDGTERSLELMYRSLVTNGREPSPADLKKLGDQIDTAARAVANEIELRELRNKHR